MYSPAAGNARENIRKAGATIPFISYDHYNSKMSSYLSNGHSDSEVSIISIGFLISGTSLQKKKL